MSHFAKVVNGLVMEVNVTEWETLNIEGHPWGDPSLWIQTSYNTHGGIHYGQDGKPDGGIALRGNFAGIGYTYDSNKDVFIPPKPYNSWVLDENTYLWNAPIAMPSDAGQGNPLKIYTWNEETIGWDLITT